MPKVREGLKSDDLSPNPVVWAVVTPTRWGLERDKKENIVENLVASR